MMFNLKNIFLILVFFPCYLSYGDNPIIKGESFDIDDLIGEWYSNWCDADSGVGESEIMSHEFKKDKLITTFYIYSDDNCSINKAIYEQFDYPFYLGPEVMSELGVKVRKASFKDENDYTHVLAIIDNILFIGNRLENKYYICSQEIWQGYTKQPYTGSNDKSTPVTPACPPNDSAVLIGYLD